MDQDDVFQTAGAIALYGAAVAGLQPGLATVIKGVQGAADRHRCSGAAFQQDGDAGLAFSYPAYNAPDGQNLVQVLVIKQGFVLDGEVDEVCGGDRDSAPGGSYEGNPAGSGIEIAIQQQSRDEESKKDTAIFESFLHGCCPIYVGSGNPDRQSGLPD